MPTSRTQPPRTPRENTNTQTSGRRFRGIELERAARTRGVNPAAQAVATMCFMCRAHARGKPQAPEARPHRPRAGGRSARVGPRIAGTATLPARGGPVPGHSSLNQRREHTTRAHGGGLGPRVRVRLGITHHACATRGRARGTRPGPAPLSQRRQPCQPRRPKKFQDFLSGAGSSGWSRRPRERAGAVGGHRGTRMASIAWIAW